MTKMTPIPVTGYYDMTRDVLNPKPDRRSKRWHQQGTLKARRVYASVTPFWGYDDATESLVESLRAAGTLDGEIAAAIARRGPAPLEVEIGVGYDCVRFMIDARTGKLVGRFADDPDPTVNALIEAWNEGVFERDHSVYAYCQVQKQERYITAAEVIDELVARGLVTRSTVELVYDFCYEREQRQHGEKS